MNDDALRLLIRAAVQRHVRVGASEPSPPEPVRPSESVRPRPEASPAMSFGQYRIERNPGETECLIEPAVPCNHCGFCKCHGH